MKNMFKYSCVIMIMMTVLSHYIIIIIMYHTVLQLDTKDI